MIYHNFHKEKKLLILTARNFSFIEWTVSSPKKSGEKTSKIMRNNKKPRKLTTSEIALSVPLPLPCNGQNLLLCPTSTLDYHVHLKPFPSLGHKKQPVSLFI